MIERLYDVFAAPRPRVVDYCDHCVKPEDVAPFTTVPLRDLTADQVETYWLRSGTIGDEDFARYLLPRVLDLIAAGELDADFYWLRIANTAHEKGDARERQAIEEYYDATPHAFTALVEECTGQNAPGERLAKWVAGREAR
ncbi:hypothetical protein [Lentzea californiensis]|uniref:hypothetical protein n=1 Tax=Lentzea californiensis TaxID=438851 RepID=UPI002164DC4A|nr:hypothetical protein [Lentzea californiensis]MCR3746869.1 hypothetical protein [Lentzea californiensis]